MTFYYRYPASRITLSSKGIYGHGSTNSVYFPGGALSLVQLQQIATKQRLATKWPPIRRHNMCQLHRMERLLHSHINTSTARQKDT